MSIEGIAVEFAREFHVWLNSLETRIFPAGWKGRVDPDIEAAARKAKALVKPANPAAPKAPKAADTKDIPLDPPSQAKGEKDEAAQPKGMATPK